MCGIGVVVVKNDGIKYAKQILLGQENRGASSTGIAYLLDGEIKVIKDCSMPRTFVEKLDGIESDAIITHSRAPSVGDVCLENAHPFLSCDKVFALAHNGTFTEYEVLKAVLTENHNIAGTTDSEIMTHFIEEYGKIKGYKKMLTAFDGQRFVLLFRDKAVGFGSFYMVRDSNGYYVFQEESVISEMFAGTRKTVYEINGYFEIDFETFDITFDGEVTKTRKRISKNAHDFEIDEITEVIDEPENSENTIEEDGEQHAGWPHWRAWL